MSREILYRGKRSDNGEWVEGTGISINKPIDGCQKERVYIGVSCPLVTYNSISTMQWFEVIPETVGDYTGLTDKNGKEIFEGDIVKTKKYGKVIGHTNVNDYDIFKIVYEPAVFRLINKNRGFNLVGMGEDYDVIGNIHDKPELLEVES